MSVASNNRRIARNTLMLYFRMAFTMGLGLFTVRVVLNELGVEDFGIYSVVAGVVTLFAFLPGTMASATQRFFSFALGEGHKEKLKSLFVSSLIIYAVVAITAFVLLETVGFFFVDGYLKIPPERASSAIWLYHFSSLTFVASIFSAPLMAIIIAHEDMGLYAIISIGDAFLKLLAVIVLVFLSGDKLVAYGALLFTVSLVVMMVYFTVCLKRYDECRVKKLHWDRCGMREILGFTGWTLFGQLTTVARNQAITVLLNQFFNPVVVAARAIAVNVSSQVNVFSSNFNTGLYPPIIKSYAAGEKEEMFSLVFNGSKLTFFLMWLFALPLFIEMDVVLTLWLKDVPAGAVLFTQLALVESLLNSLSLPLTTAARAPGNMRFYELSLGSIQIGIFFASWIALMLGAAAYSVFVIAAIANFLMFFVRLLIVRALIGISVRRFCRQTLLPVLIVGIVSLVPSLLIAKLLPSGAVWSGVIILASMLFILLSAYFFGLDRHWRRRIRELIIGKLKKGF